MTLRNRVALGFAATGLLLSSVLALASWLLVSHDVNDQRQADAVAQAEDNAQLLDDQMLEPGHRPQTLLSKLQYPPGTAALLVVGERSYSSGSALATRLPVELDSAVGRGTVQSRRVSIEGRPYLVVGVPLLHRGDGFFELSSLTDLNRTLRVLWVVLLLAAAATSLLGLAVGRVASRRLVRPFEQLTRAAAAVAHGDLSARLTADIDPDLAELARSFNKTAAELEHRVLADARFAGDVSHELRTPLTTMLNSVALLQNRRCDLPEHLLEPLDLLHEDLQRFRKLVVDLLDISRSDCGVDAQREPVRVADLVCRAADAAAGRPVTVVEPEAGAVVMLADKRRLERVVTNLVENADLHGLGCETVRVGTADGIVTIEVDDRGPGVPESDRERIFERFARDGTTGRPGVGLGLAIVARHVAWHGGRVSVADRAEGGARFTVALPPR